MRFCKDCIHYVEMWQDPDYRSSRSPSIPPWDERCMRPIEPVYNLVTGVAYPAKPLIPSDERYNFSKSACGVDAQFFEWKVKATEVMAAGASTLPGQPPESASD